MTRKTAITICITAGATLVVLGFFNPVAVISGALVGACLGHTARRVVRAKRDRTQWAYDRAEVVMMKSMLGEDHGHDETVETFAGGEMHSIHIGKPPHWTRFVFSADRHWENLSRDMANINDTLRIRSIENAEPDL